MAKCTRVNESARRARLCTREQISFRFCSFYNFLFFISLRDYFSRREAFLHFAFTRYRILHMNNTYLHT